MSDLRERLLAVMDQKNHWAWPRFAGPGLSRQQLLVHFRHEYQTYVRDFPVLLARVLGQGPPAEVRRALAANIYEEQTGGLSFGVPHPELFLEMTSGLGFRVEDLESAAPLEAEAIAYRAFLDEASASPPWIVGAAVLTIFVEGSVHERAEMAGTRDLPDVETAIRTHPMVVHYGCPPERMRLARAHRAVEGGHRDDAWRMVLDHADGGLGERVVDAVQRAHRLWRAYRDGVARCAGLASDATGRVDDATHRS
jgi:pyrroloquinoline-quinone synthase